MKNLSAGKKDELVGVMSVGSPLSGFSRFRRQSHYENGNVYHLYAVPCGLVEKAVEAGGLVVIEPRGHHGGE